MAISKKKDPRKVKKHRKTAGARVCSPTSSNESGVAKVKVRNFEVHRKLDLKQRAIAVCQKQDVMENARLGCERLGIGAVKYLSLKNNIPQLEGCTLQWKDKSRLASNIKRGHTPR